MSSALKKINFTAQDLITSFRNKDEEKLQEIAQAMKDTNTDWLEDEGDGGLCYCVQETWSHIGLYIDGAGGLGFGGNVVTFEKKKKANRPNLPPIPEEEEAEGVVIFVDFKNKKVLSKK